MTEHAHTLLDQRCYALDQYQMFRDLFTSTAHEHSLRAVFCGGPSYAMLHMIPWMLVPDALDQMTGGNQRGVGISCRGIPAEQAVDRCREWLEVNRPEFIEPFECALAEHRLKLTKVRT